jgi:hypothetical protein
MCLGGLTDRDIVAADALVGEQVADFARRPLALERLEVLVADTG